MEHTQCLPKIPDQSSVTDFDLTVQYVFLVILRFGLVKEVFFQKKKKAENFLGFSYTDSHCLFLRSGEKGARSLGLWLEA